MTEELPPLEGQEQTTEPSAPAGGSVSSSQYASNMRKRISKAEKKVKKSLQKLNLEEVPGVNRVSIRQGKLVFTIQTPEVYEISSDSYLVFGEAKVDTLSQRPNFDKLLESIKSEVAQKPTETETEIDVDETGLDPNDIEVVMNQGGVSRSVAAKALLDNNKDLVSAILSVSKSDE